MNNNKALKTMTAIAIILAALAFWRHRANIKRLLSGTENKTDVRKIGKK